jgi:hypothetical protein
MNALERATATPPPLRYNEVWTLFTSRFYFKRSFDASGAFEKLSITLARCLQALKNMAEPEDWGPNDIILVNYFVHTFQALHRVQTTTTANERQIGDDPVYLAEHDDNIYFHTGLITVNMEPIYAKFPRNTNAQSKDNQYYISDRKKHFILGIHLTQHCNPLPTQCRYFDDYSHLVMDATKIPCVNWTHIYDQNWERMCKVLYPTASHDTAGFKEQMRNEAILKLNGALTMTLNRVKANYRTAVPQYYKSQLQLLLPLCLNGTNTPDLVLTISRQAYNPPQRDKFSYVGATVLTLGMAYQNARLIARPEKDWLYAPATINEIETE